MTTAQQVVRCIRRDYGSDRDSLLEGARYCDRIATVSTNNPWADPADAHTYRDAAVMLREQAGGTISDGFGTEWSIVCPDCHCETMEVVRPGKAQCSICS